MVYSGESQLWRVVTRIIYAHLLFTVLIDNTMSIKADVPYWMNGKSFIKSTQVKRHKGDDLIPIPS